MPFASLGMQRRRLRDEESLANDILHQLTLATGSFSTQKTQTDYAARSTQDTNEISGQSPLKKQRGFYASIRIDEKSWHFKPSHILDPRRNRVQSRIAIVKAANRKTLEVLENFDWIRGSACCDSEITSHSWYRPQQILGAFGALHDLQSPSKSVRCLQRHVKRRRLRKFNLNACKNWFQIQL